MSDRIAVFNDGRIEQVGTASEVYERPAIGLRRRLRRHAPTCSRGEPAVALLGDPAPVSFRPEKIRIGPAGAAPADGEVVADGVVAEVVYAGVATRFIVRPRRRGRGAGAGPEHRRDDVAGHRPRRPGAGRVQPGARLPGHHQNASATDSVADEGEATIADRVRGTVSREGTHDQQATARDRRGDASRARGLRRRRRQRVERRRQEGRHGNEAAPQGFTPPDLKALDKLGEPEGEVNIVAWAGYVEDGSTDPTVDWVTPFEKDDRLPGQRQDGAHLRRDGQPDEDRPVRRGVGLRRRVAAADRLAATSSRSTPTWCRTTRTCSRA